MLFEDELLRIPLANSRTLGNMPMATFFLGSGIAQIFWILSMIERVWYYVGIAGNIVLILYVITRFPGNPVNGRGGSFDPTDMICEVAQVAYIGVTAAETS